MAAIEGWRIGVAAASAGALALAGCGKKSVASNDPAKVCASAETTDRIRALVFSKAATAAGSSNRYAIPKLQPQTKVSVSRPLVESYDPATRRTSCTGVLAVGLPAGVMTVGALRVPIRYSAQPLADGSGVSFDLGGADEIVAAVAGADLTVWAQANAKPEPGLVVEVAPSTGAASPGRIAQAEPAPAPPLARPAPEPIAPKPLGPMAKPIQAAPPVPSAVVAEAPSAPEPPPKLRPPTTTTPRITQREREPLPPRRPAPPLRTELARRAEPPRLPPLPPAPPLRQTRAAPVSAPAQESDGPVRVFVHVTGPDGRREANVVRARLNDLLLRGAPVATPAIRTVARTPGRNEVRCLKAADCAVARRVGAYLARSLPGGVTVVDMSRTYERDPGVRSGSLELWLKPGAAAPDAFDDDDDE